MNADRTNTNRTGKTFAYDLRPPTRARLRRRWANPTDRRVMTPNAYGWGYDLNLYERGYRLRRRRRG